MAGVSRASPSSSMLKVIAAPRSEPTTVASHPCQAQPSRGPPGSGTVPSNVTPRQTHKQHWITLLVVPTNLRRFSMSLQRDLAVMADDVESIVHALDLRRHVLVGHSM